MLRHLLIRTALVAFGTTSAQSGEWQTALQQLDVPGAWSDGVITKPRSATATFRRDQSPEAPVLHLVGGAPALPSEGADAGPKNTDTSQRPVCALDVEGSRAPEPRVLCFLPKANAIAPLLYPRDPGE